MESGQPRSQAAENWDKVTHLGISELDFDVRVVDFEDVRQRRHEPPRLAVDRIDKNQSGVTVWMSNKSQGRASGLWIVLGEQFGQLLDVELLALISNSAHRQTVQRTDHSSTRSVPIG